MSAPRRLLGNPITGALNGWTHKELFLGFGLAFAEDLPNMFIAAALGYRSPSRIILRCVVNLRVVFTPALQEIHAVAMQKNL